MTLPVTTALACGLAALLLVLSWAVIKGRRIASSSIGDAGDKNLNRKIRAQGNLIEYAPLFVILIGLAESQSDRTTAVVAISALFFAGRLAHGYAMAFTEGSPTGRQFGIVATFLAIGAAVILNLLTLVS